MRVPHNAHVALVDGERFVLMRNRGQPFEPRLEPLRELDLELTNSSAGVRHQDPAGQRNGSNDIDELAHGAVAAEWLNKRALAGEIEALLVVAEPKILGEMRKHFHGELEARIVGEIPKNLVGAPADAVAQALVNA
ncbi:MAG TPA: host attachment protein [Croceibacterium sp.]|nr:host attachment protein [Croceibacterium sp.]